MPEAYLDQGVDFNRRKVKQRSGNNTIAGKVFWVATRMLENSFTQ